MIFLIEQLAVGLYIIIGLGIVLTWRRIVREQQSYRSTYFELERNLARDGRLNAIVNLILLVEAALIVVGIQQVVAPALRLQTGVVVQTIEEIADDGVFNTPTPFMASDTAIDASSVNLTPFDMNMQVLATPTMTPTPVGTIIPNPGLVIGCESEGATLQIPANGMIVFEPITIMGTAHMPDFAFYRFEIKGPQTLGNFALLQDKNQPVTELGELGQFVPAFYLPGNYQFRLTVFDSTNTLGPSCTVNIVISEPIPTPTPIG